MTQQDKIKFEVRIELEIYAQSKEDLLEKLQSICANIWSTAGVDGMSKFIRYIPFPPKWEEVP